MKWSEQATSFLRKNYQTMFYKELAKALNRSISSVRRKCQEMGLKKDRSLSTKRSYEENPHLREVRSEMFKENARKGLGGWGWNRGAIRLPDGMQRKDVIDAYKELGNIHLAADKCGISSHKAWRICTEANAMREPVGYTISTHGYLVHTTGPNRNRPVHRVLVEKFLERKLEKDELVHHINGVKDDNNFSITQEMKMWPSEKRERAAREGIGNLQLLTRSQHIVLHHLLKYPETEKFARELFEK